MITKKELETIKESTLCGAIDETLFNRCKTII